MHFVKKIPSQKNWSSKNAFCQIFSFHKKIGNSQNAFCENYFLHKKNWEFTKCICENYSLAVLRVRCRTSGAGPTPGNTTFVFDQYYSQLHTQEDEEEAEEAEEEEAEEKEAEEEMGLQSKI